MAANLMLGLVGGLVIPILFFFVDRALRLGAWQSTTLLVMVLGSLPLIPLFLRLSARIGKHVTLMIAGIAGAAASIAMAVIPAGHIALLLAPALLFGACYSVGGFLGLGQKNSRWNTTSSSGSSATTTAGSSSRRRRRAEGAAGLRRERL